MNAHDVHVQSSGQKPDRSEDRSSVARAGRRVTQWRVAFAGGAVACVAVTTLPASALGRVAAPAFDNGGFETGDLTGWTAVDRGNGAWSADQGTRSPISGLRIPRPPEGVWQAVSDQGGPGAHVLYRDIVVGTDPVELDLTVWYRNRNIRFFSPPELRPIKDSRRNQQMRVELIDPTAWPRSVAADDILATVFRTRRGDPDKLAPTLLQQDLTAFEGQTVRLRIVEVDNQSNFQVGVDDVHLVDLPSPSPSPTPQP